MTAAFKVWVLVSSKSQKTLFALVVVVRKCFSLQIIVNTSQSISCCLLSLPWVTLNHWELITQVCSSLNEVKTLLWMVCNLSWKPFVRVRCRGGLNTCRLYEETAAANKHLKHLKLRESSCCCCSLWRRQFKWTQMIGTGYSGDTDDRDRLSRGHRW